MVPWLLLCLLLLAHNCSFSGQLSATEWEQPPLYRCPSHSPNNMSLTDVDPFLTVANSVLSFSLWSSLGDQAEARLLQDHIPVQHSPVPLPPFPFS